MRAGVSLLAAAVLCGPAQISHAGAWTQPRGQAWLKTGFHYMLTDEQFAPTAAVLEDGSAVERGDARPFNDGGAMRMRLWWNEAEYGLFDRVTVGAQLPFYDLRFEDRFQRTDSWGVGDIRLSSRIAVLNRADRLSARAAWKLPVGKAATDPDDVPIGEGQHDFDLGLQYGRSLGRDLSWLGMEGGRRWRLRDEEAGRDPGDEWFWRLELGFALRPSQPLALRIAWEGLRGAETEYDDLGVLPGQRKYDSIAAGLLYRLGNWMLETGITHRASGEAYPSGSSWNFGFNREFQLRG